MELYRSSGFYLPTAFFLHVDTDKPIDALIGEPEERILVHELVHFIQDVSTTYGLANICRYVDSLKGFSKLVRESDSLKVPVSLNLRSVSSTTNGDLFSVYAGDGADKYLTHPESVKITALEEKIENVDGVNESIPWIEIEYGEQERFHFGALAIMESMAHIVEQRLYGSEGKRSYPYDSAQWVCRHLFPEIGDNLLAVLELCEASLMFLNPAEIFVAALKKMQEQNASNLGVGEFYLFVLDNFSFGDCSAVDYFSEVCGHAQQHLDDLFTVPPFNKERWASAVIRNCSEHKAESLSALLFRNDGNNRERFFSLIKNVGFPPSFNREYQVWLQATGSDDHTHLMYPAISSISELLVRGRSACCLYDHCRASEQGYSASEQGYRTNSDCPDAPWKRAAAKQPCYYSHVWRMWGHENCEISVK